MMKVILMKYPNENDWLGVKQRALVTIGKKTTKPPTDEWKERIIKACHSPIRYLMFSFYLEDIPSWVATHLCRHVHAQPFVKSQRNDRQSEYDRTKAPQDSPVDMIWDINAEELMTVAHKRLCSQASKETRQVMQMICDEVIKVAPYMKNVLVPLCEYRGGICTEFNCCGRNKNYINKGE